MYYLCCKVKERIHGDIKSYNQIKMCMCVDVVVDMMVVNENSFWDYLSLLLEFNFGVWLST
jgi:hypothetical protein